MGKHCTSGPSPRDAQAGMNLGIGREEHEKNKQWDGHRGPSQACLTGAVPVWGQHAEVRRDTPRAGARPFFVFKTPHICYLTASVGRQSGHSLAGPVRLRPRCELGFVRGSGAWGAPSNFTRAAGRTPVLVAAGLARLASCWLEAEGAYSLPAACRPPTCGPHTAQHRNVLLQRSGRFSQ